MNVNLTDYRLDRWEDRGDSQTNPVVAPPSHPECQASHANSEHATAGSQSAKAADSPLHPTRPALPALADVDMSVWARLFG